MIHEGDVDLPDGRVVHGRITASHERDTNATNIHPEWSPNRADGDLRNGPCYYDLKEILTVNIKSFGFDDAAVEAAYLAEAQAVISANFTSFDRIDSASVEQQDTDVLLIVSANKENVGSGSCESVYKLSELARERILWYEKEIRVSRPSADRGTSERDLRGDVLKVLANEPEND